MPMPRHQISTLLAFAAISTLSACLSGTGSGDGEADQYAASPECRIEPMREWVNENMKDYYLFYDQVPTVNLNNYSEIENLITDLRVSPYDRYSYIADEALNTALFEEGKRFGFGMRFIRTEQNELRFTLINPGSPLDDEGVERGDQLLAINGVQIGSPGMTDEFVDSALGTGDTVVTPTFTIKTAAGVTRDLTATKAMFDVQTVLDTNIVQVGASKVGYLHFYSFLETSSSELDQAFAVLKDANIDELVLDLRYNGGGRISVANELASKIVGSAALEQDFTYFSYNDKYAFHNQGYKFLDEANSLGLNRVFALTTDGTCSASELVINGLRPHIDVITVGATSCGKPYGTQGNSRCGKVMHALEVEFVNSARVGGYFDGISADCPAADNVFQSPGDANENMMAAALAYINEGSCPLVAARSSKRNVVELENPGNAEKRHLTQ